MNGKGFRQVFRNRNYLLLWLGQTISQIGDAVSLVAMPLLVFELTNSVTELTLTFVLEAIPWILIGPIAGVFIDRIDRKRLLIATDLIRAVLIGCVFFIEHVWAIYVIAFLMQTMATINTPVRSAIIPELLDRDLYVKAIGLSHTTFQMVQVIGPFLAAGVLSLTGGPRPVFLLDSLTFLICVAMALMMRFPPSAERGEKKVESATTTFAQMIQVGAKFLFTHPVMRYITCINVLKAAVQAFILIGSLLYVKTTLAMTGTAGDRMYSLVVAAMAVGVITGTLLIGTFEKRLQRRYLIVGGLMLQGAVLLLLQLHPGPALLFVLFLIAGFGSSGAMTPVSAFYAETTPNEIRGRVYSMTNSMLRVSSLSAYLLAGPIGERYGAVALLTLTAALLLIGTPLFTLFFQGLRVLQTKN